MTACQNPIGIGAVARHYHEQMLAEAHQERLVDRATRNDGAIRRSRWSNLKATVAIGVVLAHLLAVGAVAAEEPADTNAVQKVREAAP